MNRFSSMAVGQVLPCAKVFLPFGSPRTLVRTVALAASTTAYLATPAQAATVTQSVSLVTDEFRPFVETEVPSFVGIENSDEDSSSLSEELTAEFDSFDTSLGTLTGVSWYFDIQGTMAGDTQYGCSGLFSVKCLMDTTLETELSAIVTAAVSGTRTHSFDLPNGDTFEIEEEQLSILTASMDPLVEVEEKSGSGIVGCFAQELSGLGDGCQGGTEQNGMIQEEQIDDPLEAYTNGDIDLYFNVNLDTSVDTTCRPLGVLGICGSWSSPDASASMFASMTYEYTPFEDPNGGDVSAVPVPASLAFGVTGILALFGFRSARRNALFCGREVGVGRVAELVEI